MKYVGTKELDAEQLLNLYTAVGWGAYSNNPEDLVPMVRNCWYVYAAFDEDALVGLARVVGDGFSVAYIQDLLVLPDYQRQGIGRELMNRVLTRISEAKIRQTYLTTDSAAANQHVIDFYLSLGFKNVDGYECTTLAQFTF
ncbi:GNAT family N-acetyltransferase [Rothia terrae]|uniref:GNAT family N-acetyltransferase n=1 Tax=Rothia terrae TaxID=396015 RepID=UPI002882BAA7|nr:GNAT family N-acetyltransferase [Rothia terrae]MDT0189660.1 GNAT family N-acetyltransferase [Rothia terrae]